MITRMFEKFDSTALENEDVRKTLNDYILGEKSVCSILCSVDSSDIVASMVQQAEKHGKLDQLELIHCVYEATEADEKEAFDCTGESNHLKSFLLNEISDTTGFIDEHVPVASAIHNQECPEVHFLFSTVDGNTGRVYSDFLNDVNQLVTLREKE